VRGEWEFAAPFQWLSVPALAQSHRATHRARLSLACSARPPARVILASIPLHSARSWTRTIASARRSGSPTTHAIRCHHHRRAYGVSADARAASRDHGILLNSGNDVARSNA
jgi:hypothetical protein